MGWRNTRATIANTIRNRPDADVTHLRRKMDVERHTDHILAELAKAPRMTKAELAPIVGALRAYEAVDEPDSQRAS